MAKWEYKILELSSSGGLTGQTKISASKEQTEALLSALGRQGWELVGIFTLIGRTGFGEPETKKVNFVFKRESLES